MRRLVLAVALALLPSLALAQAPPPSKSALVTYYAGDPFGACSGYQRLWWNTTTNVLWFCEGGTWISTIASAGTSFPLLAPNGLSTAPSYSFTSFPTEGMYHTTESGQQYANVKGGNATGTHGILRVGLQGRWTSKSGGTTYSQFDLGTSGFAFDTVGNFSATPDGYIEFHGAGSHADFGTTVGLNTAMARFFNDAHFEITGAVSGGAQVSVTGQTSGGGGVLVMTQASDGAGNVSSFSVSPSGLAVTTGGTKPTCSVTFRSYLWIVTGGAGVADTFEVCAKDAGDAYAWRALW
jgi:hypothetical protein